MAELEAILPDLRKTRWRKKSDFYSLFLTFVGKADALPLSREGRELATELVSNFGKSVDDYLATDKSRQKRVRSYGDSVARAASAQQDVNKGAHSCGHGSTA